MRTLVVTASAESEQRKGRYIRTFTGKQFWPLDPRAAEVDLEDVAHSLSMQPRFTGHVCRGWNVAAHSITVANYCKPYGDNVALWGLLHDAGEAYLADVASPTKEDLRDLGFTIFDELEDRILKVVAERFDLFPSAIPPNVKKWDKIIADEEGKQFVRGYRGRSDLPRVALDLKLCDNKEAKKRFLLLFEELTMSRK